MHTHDGPQIERRTSNLDELMLEDLTVLTPCGERTLCKVSSTASESSIALLMAAQILVLQWCAGHLWRECKLACEIVISSALIRSGKA